MGAVRRKRFLVSVVSVMVIITLSVLLGVLLEPSGNLNLVLAILSAIVALLALCISLCTYISIDEVNAISRMDGNVMENSRYLPNVLRMIFYYKQNGMEETGEAVLLHWEKLFRKDAISTGAHLSDNLQEVVDMMVLVPFLIRSNDKETSNRLALRISALIDMMKKHVADFKNITDGSCKLLDETVALVDAVFSYQNIAGVKEVTSHKLMSIRGSMFINPVSVVLYNDYMGLYFMRCARDVVGLKSGDVMSYEERARIGNCLPDKRALALTYVNKALHHFTLAKDASATDIVWNSFINYNIARAEYLGHILDVSFKNSASNNNTSKTWVAAIDESIKSWITANRIISEHMSRTVDGNTWLRETLARQENKAIITKIIYQILEGEPLTDHYGNRWVENYADIVNTDFYKIVSQPDPTDRTNNLVKVLQELIS